MDNYICANCKFKFKAMKLPSACPYCNKKSVEKDKTADELVEEIEELLE